MSKIAILADIHGNWPALQAVTEDIEQWEPDIVIVNGDMINRGPSNFRCLRYILEREQLSGWKLLRGNHEDYVLTSANPHRITSGPEAENRQISDWTWEQVTEFGQDIMRFPDRYSWTGSDQAHLFVTHGSPRGNRVGIYPWSTEEDIRPLIAPGPAVFVTAHTHRSLVKMVDQTLVVNIGAAGLPFDGDWRSSYGRFTWNSTSGWKAEIRRIEYDRDQALRDLDETGFMSGAGPFASLIKLEYELAQSMIHRWAEKYNAPFRKGEISLRDSVARFLREAGYD